MMRAMTGLLRNGILGLGLLAVASFAALSQAPQAERHQDGAVVMSDTPEWCARLAREVAALRQSLSGPYPQADMLARQGQRLCGSGHVRLGIIRLRYALMHLQAIRGAP